MRTTHIPFCRHTKTDGRLCQSPAVTGSAFCYHHQKIRRTRKLSHDAGPGLSGNVLYPLRGAASVQHALEMVRSGLATGQIEPAKAGRMIYALRLAMEINRRTRME
jgi:hypothetical protein